MPDPNSPYSLALLPSADGSRALRFALQQHGTPLTFEAVITGWCADQVFRAAYNDLLAADPRHEGYYWEHPPLTRDRLAEAYEFVLLPTQAFSRLRPNPAAFAEHFNTTAPVVHFPNLGGDTELIVPCPVAEDRAYLHLAAFVRHAPPAQRDAFWQRVGERCRALIDDRPHWLSTAGLGVYWLHVRLGMQPRYYKYGPYRESPAV